MPSLTHQSLKGALWTFVQRGGQQIIRFGVTVVLARLLAPEAFGLLAMLEVFLVVSEKFIHAGFGSALIQKKEVTNTDLNTLFYYNLAVSVAVYGVLFLSAPSIARFYNQPDLVDITRVSALSLICMGFQVVQSVQFSRRMDFRIPTLASFGALLASAVIGIAMAFNGYGVWSLVWSGLARRIVEGIWLWIASAWMPSLEFSVSSVRQIVRFGAPILTASLLDGFFSNLHTIVIGKVYSAGALGFFNRARAVQSIAIDSTTAPLFGVLFPAFSRIHHEPERLAAAYLRVLQVAAFVLFPVLFSLALVADPLVLLVYSEKWRVCTPYLYWLAIVGVWYPLSLISFGVVKSLGDGFGFLRMSLTRHLFSVVAIALTYSSGIVPIIIGIGVAQALVFLSVCASLTKCIPTTLLQQLLAIAPALVLSCAAHLACLAIPWSQNLPLIARVIFPTGLFLLIYGISATLLRLKGLRHLLDSTRMLWTRWSLSYKLITRFCAWMG